MLHKKTDSLSVLGVNKLGKDLSKMKDSDNLAVGKPNDVNGEVIENNYTFLIADNDVVNIMFIEMLLLKKLEFDCRIIHVVNGLEAVEICKTHTNIDLILMDLKMPIMSGFEATKLIKEFSPNALIIAQSAYSSIEDKRRAEDAGCSDFIMKPIKKEILNNIIKKHVKANLNRN